jgi:type IV secretory pathway VirB10-like protein
MRLIELAGDQLAAFASGMLDVIFTFAVVLERKGLLTRAEIAETLRAVQAQVAEQEPGRRRQAPDPPPLRPPAVPPPPPPPPPPPRRRRRPDAQRVRSARAGVQVRDRWRVIDGGNPAETENGAGRQP